MYGSKLAFFTDVRGGFLICVLPVEKFHGTKFCDLSNPYFDWDAGECTRTEISTSDMS